MMSEAAASAKSKPLLLVESNVEDAFAFSRTLKAAQLQCDFYMVATIEAAKRYLSAGSTDAACVPAVIVVSLGLDKGVTEELLSWISAREHLRGCAVLTLAENGATEAPGGVPSLQKPVSPETARRALLAHVGPIAAKPLAAV